MKTTAKPINKFRKVEDQIVSASGHFFSLQTRTHFDGRVSGLIVEEFFAPGVKSNTKRWQFCELAAGPIDWVLPQWKVVKNSHQPKETK